MELFYNTTSPFARKCSMVLHLNGLINETELVLTNPFDDAYKNTNPLGKVPALVDGDLTLFDSPLMCEYLDDTSVANGGLTLLHKNTPHYYPIQQIHSQADGILDAAVSTLFETRRETEQSDYWMSRWHSAIKTGVGTLPMDKLGNVAQPNMGTVATIAALGYLDFRMAHYGWRDWNAALAEWYANCQDASWVEATLPK
ncbi:MAG: glutathione S-transferase [Lentisphaeria bacterium]|jgi:glutathione S-transferase